MRKKRKLLWLLAVMAGFGVFQACSPHDIEPESSYKYQLIYSNEPVRIYIGPIGCEGAGTTCAKVESCPEPNTAPREALDSFYVAYDNNNLSNFFNGTSWELIFPDLADHSDAVKNIRDGVYGVFVDTQDNVLISTQNNIDSINSGNILFGYQFKYSCRTIAP